MFSPKSADIPAVLILILLAERLRSVSPADCGKVRVWMNVVCESVGRRTVKVTCKSPCSSGPCYYDWYRDGGHIGCSYGASLWVDSSSSSDQGSYSCSAYYVNNVKSLPYCELVQWGVTYSPERVCALKGSSVDLSCSYKHPAGLTVTKSIWFLKVQKQPGGEPEDIREDERYQNRVEYDQNQTHRRLRITDLRESDSGEYRFKIYTDDPDGKYTRNPGVTLNVTELKVTVSDTERGVKKLNCSTSCVLSEAVYVWYKNGEPVSNENRNELDLNRTVGGDIYSCAVKGHEDLRSPAVYPPRRPSLSEDVFNGSVTLLCVSDSNPASNYTWFRKTGRDVQQFGRGSSLTLAPGTDGVFYCEAQNPFGSSTTSTEWPFKSDNSGLMSAFSALAVILLLVLIAVICVIRRKRGAQRDSNVQAPTSGDDTYTALNPINISPDYDTLTFTPDSPSDTYSSLNPAVRTSDYETLNVVGPRPQMRRAPVVENDH